MKAEHLYEQAIRSASANGFLHNEAVANELAARFYAARGFQMIAHTYLRKARHSYLLWGAAGKVRQLDELYPQLREEEPMPGPTSTIGTSAEHLDLATIIKVSQAVAGEIVLEKLIDTLMRTAIENAGAERGLLIFPRGVEQRIEAEVTTSGETIMVRLREASMGAAAVPESIVHYVVRTRESVILDDASLENPFSADTYLRQRQARSILCLPLINQTKLIGLLYLENNLTPHVFTLGEKALQQKEVSLHETQAALAHVSRVTTMGELAASIAHEVNQPLVGVVTNAGASQRYLNWDSPNFVAASEAIRAIIRDGNRAAEVVSRVRALFKKACPAKEPLNINEAIEEVVRLTQAEARRNKVTLQVELAANVPSVLADRPRNGCSWRGSHRGTKLALESVEKMKQ